MNNWLTQMSLINCCRHNMDEMWQDSIFIIFQAFSIGFRSGLFPGHCKTSIFFLSKPQGYFLWPCGWGQYHDMNFKNIQQVVLENGDVAGGIHCNILEKQVQTPMTK
ncbi:hypothetical protein OTU49_015537 [Cherax quadricarinatus]|uniref:Uncharacterized protein n=1 Tax=Cherax quadricarinatus TaxID=27406 RepID=A0AAW0YCQ5_CHEQU